jgi:hypothetical protein
VAATGTGPPRPWPQQEWPLWFDSAPTSFIVESRVRDGMTLIRKRSAG